LDLQLTTLTEADTTEIGSWRYDAPYDTYNMPVDDAAVMLEPGQRFSAVRDGAELIAYVCLGGEARVKGLEPEPGTDDLGFGLRPDLMGRDGRERSCPGYSRRWPIRSSGTSCAW